MDPDVTLARLRDPDIDPDDRLDAADALTDWIAKGGFLPACELDDLVAEIAHTRAAAAAATHRTNGGDA